MQARLSSRALLLAFGIVTLGAATTGCRRRPPRTQLGVVSAYEVNDVIAANSRARGCASEHVRREGVYLRCPSELTPDTTVTLLANAQGSGESFLWTCPDGPTMEAECRALFDALRRTDDGRPVEAALVSEDATAGDESIGAPASDAPSDGSAAGEDAAPSE